MAIQKRSREETTSDRTAKKQNRGFTVGPANLPDGTYKRKTQQIKKDLIAKAKLKKEYARVQAREGEQLRPSRSVYDGIDAADAEASKKQDAADAEAAQEQHVPEPNTERHPDRTALIESTPREPTPDAQDQQQTGEQAFRQRRQRKPKPVPFAREHAEAQQRKEEAEQRRLAYEEGQRQRQQKLEERERFRKAMAKARTGGKNGQRKLGRESKVLLERVQRIVSET